MWALFYVGGLKILGSTVIGKKPATPSYQILVKEGPELCWYRARTVLSTTLLPRVSYISSQLLSPRWECFAFLFSLLSYFCFLTERKTEAQIARNITQRLSKYLTVITFCPHTKVLFDTTSFFIFYLSLRRQADVRNLVLPHCF